MWAEMEYMGFAALSIVYNSHFAYYFFFFNQSIEFISKQNVNKLFESIAPRYSNIIYEIFSLQMVDMYIYTVDLSSWSLGGMSYFE